MNNASAMPWRGARRRIPIGAILLGFLLPAASIAEEPPPQGADIRDLAVENAPHDLFVSFRLVGAFPREIHEQIESGLPVTFNHYVEVVLRRAAWFDSSIVKKVVSTTVNYDTVTRQYRLTRSVDGEVLDTTVSDKDFDMEQFMTTVSRLRLADPAEIGGDRPLYLRVKSRMQRRFVLLFIPWDFETTWAKIGLSVGALQAEPPR